MKTLAHFALKTSFLMSVFLGPHARAVTAYEAPPGAWNSKSWGFSLSGEHFSSIANYDDSRGSFTNLPDGGTYTSIDARLKARYNLNQRWSLFAGSGFGYARAVNTTVDKSNSEVTDAFLGANFILSKKIITLIPEFQFGYPMSPTDPAQVNPLTNDGVIYGRVGLFAQAATKRFKWGTYTGFHFPGSGLAKRFLYEITGDMRLFSAVTIGVGFNGYETLMNDDKTFIDRHNTATLSSVGSHRFYAYDPAMMEARAWIGFRPDSSLWIRVGYGQTIDGMYTAEGSSILFSISYNSLKTVPAPKNRPSHDQALKDFEVDVENTEQGIFDMEAREQPKDPLDATEKMLEEKNRKEQKR